jgi:hypothetical protein
MVHDGTRDAYGAYLLHFQYKRVYLHAVLNKLSTAVKRHRACNLTIEVQTVWHSTHYLQSSNLIRTLRRQGEPEALTDL